MDVLLIYPSQGQYEIAPNVRITLGALIPPLGLLYIARMLQLEGHRVRVIDCSAESSPSDAIQRALSSVDVVGMTVYSGPKELSISRAIARMIKNHSPDTKLILGGPHCFIFPRQALEDHQADVCIQGEAEYRIGSLLDALQGKKPFSSIPGIVYRKGTRVHSRIHVHSSRTLTPFRFPPVIW